jgi:hypothetical protein
MRYEHAASAITVAAPGQAVEIGGAQLVMGWSLRETTGAATATVEVFDGQDTTGQLLASISLNPGQSIRDWLGPGGLETDIGVFVSVLSGSVRGAIWVRLRERDQS